jgi:acetyl-CoA carboxylase carboxyltransferase component
VTTLAPAPALARRSWAGGTVPMAAWAGTSVSCVGEVAGRRAVRCAIGGDHRRGALSALDSNKIATGAMRAVDLGLPLLVTMSTVGAEVGDGVAALHGWGVAAAALARCSGVVPVLVVVDGPVVSGLALLLGLADVVVMTDDGFAYVSGPKTVEDITGVVRSPQQLGGAWAHASVSGLAAHVVSDVTEGLAWLDHLLGYLPPNTDEEPGAVATLDPPDRRTPSLRAVLPARPKQGYDVRAVISTIVDDGGFVELWARWAANMVTGFAALAGHPIGVVANQPQVMAGTIDIAASHKAARFVAFCDAFNVPILTSVDTPGFLPGVDLEWRGMIRHGAQLAYAYAEATVPRIALITRKAYGGAYIVMDSRAMGCDFALAWPSAEIAVMGARGAVQILHRRADEPTRRVLEDDYQRTFANPYVAAARGFVDAVVDPADTRRALADALTTLRTKREPLPPPRRHGNCVL